MGKLETVVYVRVSDVFPDLTPDHRTFVSLLQSLSLTDTLFRCARINLILSGPSDDNRFRRQDVVIRWCFSGDEIAAINGIAQKQGGAQNVAAFSRGTMLEMIRWASLVSANLPGNGETFEDVATRRTFAQAALVANDIWGERTFSGRLEPGDPIEVSRRKALSAFRKTYEITRETPQLGQRLGRGWYLFEEYFPRQWPTFHADFEAKSGLSFFEYYVCLCAIVSCFLDPKQSNCIFDAKGLGKGTP